MVCGHVPRQPVGHQALQQVNSQSYEFVLFVDLQTDIERCFMQPFDERLGLPGVAPSV